MAPAYALRGRQAKLRQRISDGIHADFRIIEDVEIGIGNGLSGNGDFQWQLLKIVCMLTKEIRHGVIGLTEREDADAKLAAIQVGNQPFPQLTDRMDLEEPRDESDVNPRVSDGR